MNTLNNEHCLDPQLLAEINSAMVTVLAAESPVLETVVSRDEELSDRYRADIWLASELHQPIGAYKIRGAYNFVSNLNIDQQARGIVTASAGNHAQGVALASRLTGVSAEIFMPENTPLLKIEQVAYHGGDTTSVTLEGETYDDSQQAAIRRALETNKVFASPFNDINVIAGQGTWGVEISERVEAIDSVICPVGGMGLFAGIGTAIKSRQPKTKLIAVEPVGASSLAEAYKNGGPNELEDIDTFIDGASVKSIGEIPFRLAGHLVERQVQVTNHQARRATRQLWLRESPIRAELAGALSVAALEHLASEICGQTVVCLVSGGNLSQARFEQQVR